MIGGIPKTRGKIMSALRAYECNKLYVCLGYIEFSRLQITNVCFKYNAIKTIARHKTNLLNISSIFKNKSGS